MVVVLRLGHCGTFFVDDGRGVVFLASLHRMEHKMMTQGAHGRRAESKGGQEEAMDRGPMHPLARDRSRCTERAKDKSDPITKQPQKKCPWKEDTYFYEFCGLDPDGERQISPPTPDERGTGGGGKKPTAPREQTTDTTHITHTVQGGFGISTEQPTRATLAKNGNRCFRR